HVTGVQTCALPISAVGLQGPPALLLGEGHATRRSHRRRVQRRLADREAVEEEKREGGREKRKSRLVRPHSSLFPPCPFPLLFPSQRTKRPTHLTYVSTNPCRNWRVESFDTVPSGAIRSFWKCRKTSGCPSVGTSR